LDEIKKVAPEADKVNERLRQIKTSRTGFKRQEARYKMFKDYLTNKTTLEQAKVIVEKSMDLKVNANEESLHLG
jgi:hypothetical protein